VIVAEDEACLYLQVSLMRVWAPTGQTPVVRAAASRDNTHFYGALNLLTGEQTWMRSDLMNAQATVLFLLGLLAAYPEVPILLLWDRAPWHRGCQITQLLAAHPRLEIVWFPPGCPELNPQEHVWKASREAVSHNHGCATLPELAEAFARHLDSAQFPCSLLDRHGYREVCAMSM